MRLHPTIHPTAAGATVRRVVVQFHLCIQHRRAGGNAGGGEFNERALLVRACVSLLKIPIVLLNIHNDD